MVRKNLIVGMMSEQPSKVIVGEPRPDGTIIVVGLGLSPSDNVKRE